MTPEEIGHVYNELRTRRILFNRPVKGRNRSASETDALQILSKCGDGFRDIEEFLATQALSLIVVDLQSIGVAGDGVAYVVVRDANVSSEDVPSHICGGQIVRALSDNRKGDETAEQLGIWGVFMTLILLYFLYTRDERPIESVSGFRDSSVDVEEYIEEASKRIGVLRTSLPTESRRVETIKATLIDSSDKGLEGRVRGFFRRMVELGVLEKIEDVAVQVEGKTESAYSQTLWSAVDLAQNFRHYAPHLGNEAISEQIEAVGSNQSALTVDDSFDNNEEYEDVSDQ